MHGVGGINKSWFPELWGRYPNGARLFSLPCGVLFSLFPQFGKELDEVERLGIEIAEVARKMSNNLWRARSLPEDSRLKRFDKDERWYWAQRFKEDDEIHQQYLEQTNDET